MRRRGEFRSASVSELSGTSVINPYRPTAEAVASPVGLIRPVDPFATVATIQEWGRCLRIGAKSSKSEVRPAHPPKRGARSMLGKSKLPSRRNPRGYQRSRYPANGAGGGPSAPPPIWGADKPSNSLLGPLYDAVKTPITGASI